MASARFLDPSSIPLKRQSGGNIWATLGYITQGLTLAALVTIVMLFFVPPIQNTHRLQREKDRLQAAIAAAQDRQTQLKVETEHMKNDTAYIEHVARDRLNMGKPGETIVRFDKYQPTPSTMKPAEAPTMGDVTN